MMVREIQIHNVLNRISVGKLFRILAQIRADDVARVRKCIYHNSTPNTKPGTMIIAFAIQAKNSIVL
jgi:hypothetical protein